MYWAFFASTCEERKCFSLIWPWIFTHELRTYSEVENPQDTPSLDWGRNIQDVASRSAFTNLPYWQMDIALCHNLCRPFLKRAKNQDTFHYCAYKVYLISKKQILRFNFNCKWFIHISPKVNNIRIFSSITPHIHGTIHSKSKLSW